MNPSQTGKPGIRIERTFNATPQRVWAMWTTKQGLDAWFAPLPWKATFTQVDVRVGGGYEGDFSDGEQTIHNHGTYTEVTANKVLAWTDRFDMLPDIPAYDTFGRIELHPIPGGTRMLFTHSALHSQEWTNNAAEGWTSTIAQLARILDNP